MTIFAAPAVRQPRANPGPEAGRTVSASARDPTAANRLEVWLQGLYGLFGERVLPITREIAEEWGRLNAQRPLPAADSLLGATANVHRLVLATRNVKDLDRTGVELVNPFEFQRG
mgnify:CR=1 FL=1